MANDRPLPIVLLVYANDRVDPANHLRNLSEEIGRIRDALQAAERAGLCQVRIEANASADRLFSVLQDARYRNRIAILHYAGHANGYQLLLESASGGHGAAHAEGLAAFLGHQRALELVFLNGCSTEQQVQGLLDANCAAVIATSQAIDDQVAMDFASRFYKGLGGGASLEQAYNEAVAAVQTQTGSNPRALYWGDAAVAEALARRPPWELKVKPGAESARQWNLPDAVGNPLFGLPGVPTLDLPESPFRHLQWFDREHAEVFFGRGFQIRKLFQAVITEGVPPIVLFYGQSGVGKSSVLDAGLLPRLETTHRVHYLRRDQSRGLLGTLLAAFGDAEGTPGDAWRSAEGEQGLPVLVVLDQAEEVFTRPKKGEQPDELETFADGLHDIFGQAAHQPRGRLILGFRKEWLPEIEKCLAQRRLPRSREFLETMDRRGVIEAITGPTRSARLQDFYKLEIEPALAGEIADDLLGDRESPVAPTLQILLTKLWDRAREENFAHPKFTRDRYLTFKRDGILLGDFFDQQFHALEQWRPEVVQSGLALDVLAFHTTPKGTAAQCTAEELQTRYVPNGQVVADLVEECKKGYLLSDISSTQLAPRDGTRLGHDTLAPLVRERFDESDRPGQRARRILESRVVDWTDEKTGPVLDDADLIVVEKGVTGMRAWTDDEERLVKASRTEAERRRHVRKRWVTAGVIAFLAIVFAAVFSAVQRQQAKRQERMAIARLQVLQASAIRDKYPLRALLLAADAVKRTLDAEVTGRGGPESMLRDLVASIGGFPLHGHESGVTSLAFDPRNRWLATAASYETSVRLWDLQHPEAKPKELLGHKDGVTSLAFDPLGRWLATGSKDTTVRIWDLHHLELKPKVLYGHPYAVDSLAFDPQGRWLATGGSAVPDKTARLWDLRQLEPKLHELHGHEGGVYAVAFDPQGRWLATGSGDKTARLWDLQHLEAKPQVLQGHEMAVTSLSFDPQGRWLATGGSGDNTARLWDLHHPKAEPQVLSGHENGLNALAFDPQGRWLATGGGDNTPRLWNLQHPKAESRELRGHESGVYTLAFDPQGRWLATGSYDKTVRLWDLQHLEAKPQVLQGHRSIVTTLAFDIQGRWLASVADSDTAVCLWDLQHLETEPRLLTSRDNFDNFVSEIAFDPLGRWLAIAAEFDTTVRVWDLEQPKAEPSVLPGQKYTVSKIAFDPQGRWLAVGNQTVRLWDPRLPKAQPQELRGHEGSMTSLAFDPQGRWLATSSKDNTARLWDLQHPEAEPQVLRGHEDTVYTLAFDPQGRWLATGSEDGTVRLWQLDIRPLLDKACQTAGRNLTLAEWHQYVGNTSTKPPARNSPAAKTWRPGPAPASLDAQRERCGGTPPRLSIFASSGFQTAAYHFTPAKAFNPVSEAK